MILIEEQKSKISRKNKNESFIKTVEAKYIKYEFLDEEKLEIGDLIRVGYIIPEGDKDRTQYYEGLVIAKKNRGLGKSFTIRRSIQGIGIEQIFLLNSPKILFIQKKQSSKVRRSKLYFLRKLRGKSTRLKIKL
jgi:large subunit ribosomal protein L19